MRSALAVAALLALCACGGQEEAAPTSAPKSDTAPLGQQPGDFSGEFNALGTEPFWAVEVRPEGLKLMRPGEEDRVYPNPGPRVEGAKAVWPAQGLVLTLTEGQCSDGMSDRIYAWYAEITLPDVTMKGCAARPETLLANRP